MSARPIPSPEIQPRKGWAPLPNGAVLEWARLTSGAVQITALIYINSEIHGPREQGSPVPYWSRPITHAEIAVVCRSTIRAVEIKLKDLTDRGVLEYQRTGSGNKYHIPFDKWAGLPDISPVETLHAPPADEDETTDEERDRRKFEFSLPPKKLRGGGRAKPVPMNCSPSHVGVTNETGFGISFGVKATGGGPVIVNILNVDVPQTAATSTRVSDANREQKAKPKPSSVSIQRADAAAIKALHNTLDSYCLRHHSTIPDDKLLSRVAQTLQKTPIEAFEHVFQAKARALHNQQKGPVPIGLLVKLAEDAARGHKHAGALGECKSCGTRGKIGDDCTRCNPIARRRFEALE